MTVNLSRRWRIAATLVGAALAATACTVSPGPASSATSPSPSESTAHNSATPIPSEPTTRHTAPPPLEPSASSVFVGRDPEMSDGEALGRLASPATGEAWFQQPRSIAVPEWAAGVSYLDQPSVTWYELGTRGTRTIVAYSDDYLTEFFERTLDGTWEWIAFPSARDNASDPVGTFFVSPDVPTNKIVYYDSLSTPREFSLPSGAPLVVPAGAYGDVNIPGYAASSEPSSTTVDTIGGYSIELFEVPVQWIWGETFGTSDPDDIQFFDVFYMAATPYGTWIPLTYLPFEDPDDIVWTAEPSISADDFTYLADLMDMRCGTSDHDHNTGAVGTIDSDWELAGFTSDGEAVFTLSGSNPIAQPLWDAYVAHASQQNKPFLNFDAWRKAPAVISMESPDNGYRLVFLNGTHSARAWC